MKKIQYIIISILAVFLSSCEYSDSSYRYNVGDDFIEDNIRAIMIDTMTVNTFTVSYDTLATSKSDVFLAGRKQNKFGIITTCESYFRLDPSGSQFLHESAKFDSICFILNLSGYNSGDTTKICKFQLHRVTEEITVDENTERIYNNKQFSYDPSPLASFSVDLNDEDLDSVVMKLPAELGQELFDLAYDEDRDDEGNVILDDPDIFKEEYKGFVVRTEDNNISCIVGFVADPDTILAPKIRVYYHDYTFDDNQYFDFKIEEYTTSESSNVNYYSNIFIKNDYSNFFVKEMLDPEEKLPSEKTGNSTVLQGGVNLRTRIEIPWMDHLYYLGIGSIIKAELYFEPLIGTYVDASDLPSTLEMYVVDQKNRFYNQLYSVGTSNIAYGTLHYNEEFKNEIYYSFDITQYLVDEYINRGDPKYTLLLTLPQSTINYNVDQLIIGDQNHPINGLKLKVYIATYNQ